MQQRALTSSAIALSLFLGLVTHPLPPNYATSLGNVIQPGSNTFDFETKRNFRPVLGQHPNTPPDAPLPHPHISVWASQPYSKLPLTVFGFAVISRRDPLEQTSTSVCQELCVPSKT